MTSYEDHLRHIREQKNYWRRQEARLVKQIQRTCRHDQDIHMYKMPKISFNNFNPNSTVTTYAVCKQCGKRV